MKSFRHWKTQEVDEAFGLVEHITLPLLDKWLLAKYDFSTREKETLEQLRIDLEINVKYWNEADIKFNFLGPLMRLVNYFFEQFKPFTERELSVAVNGEITKGLVDFMIAKGKQLPRTPYFCLHEYKSEPNTSNDPLGQLLIAMVAAQYENQSIDLNIPIYGAYTIGRMFYFVILHEKNYAVSNGHNAVTPQLFEIFAILYKVKDYAVTFVPNQ